MNEFVMALLGGSMIGLAASMLLLSLGRVAGISGIVGGIFNPSVADKDWRIAFFVGLLVGGGVLYAMDPTMFGVANVETYHRSPWMMVVAGLLVGVGTQMGSGCTSGHGVCGITRFSPRSLVATGAFMFSGMLIASVLSKIL